jgi:hypothetical protein
MGVFDIEYLMNVGQMRSQGMQNIPSSTILSCSQLVRLGFTPTDISSLRTCDPVAFAIAPIEHLTNYKIDAGFTPSREAEINAELDRLTRDYRVRYVNRIFFFRGRLAC